MKTSKLFLVVLFTAICFEFASAEPMGSVAAKSSVAFQRLPPPPPAPPGAPRLRRSRVVHHRARHRRSIHVRLPKLPPPPPRL